MNVEALLEVLGGVAIASAAAGWSALMAVRSNRAALITVSICAIILTPFLLLAAIVVGLGMLCCLPILVAGITIAWAPTIMRAVQSGAGALHELVGTRGKQLWESDAVQQVLDYMRTHPLVALGCGAGLISCLPVIAFITVVALCMFVLFSPVTVPLSLFTYYYFFGERDAEEEVVVTEGVAAPADTGMGDTHLEPVVEETSPKAMATTAHVRFAAPASRIGSGFPDEDESA